MARKKNLETVLELHLTNRASLSTVLTTLDTFVSNYSNASYATYQYREDCKDTIHPFFVRCVQNIACTRNNISNKMADVDNLLTSLPTVIKLKYRYDEDENQE